MVDLADLTSPAPPPGPADWNDDGVVILPRLFSGDMLAAYEAAWELDNAERPHGWPDTCPYMRVPELRQLLCDPFLATALEQTVGEPMAVHLNLTGWKSTERRWHQDGYLNPPHVGDRYAAVWVALDDIDPASGPFQYVPGSHRWPQITQQAMGRITNLAEPMWPWHTEELLAELFEAEIGRRAAEVVTYLPRRGDVLLWHSRLLHQGSKPADPEAWRPALIAHYSGIGARPDMPPAARGLAGGWYFPIVQYGSNGIPRPV